MSSFVQAKEYDMMMYENFECMNMHLFLQRNASRFYSCNFIQCNNAQMYIWSSLVHRFTQ
jgi:hypothetical protein